MNAVTNFLPPHPKAQTSYEMLRKVNVNEKIERKNGLAYLSWAFAVDTLLQHDPDANWSYADPKAFGETWMVFCSVTAFGRTRTAQLPVMDHRNKAIANPDAFSFNTAMQRCLVKAIALHGLGLYIYAGEDLPASDDGSAVEKTMQGFTDGPARPDTKRVNDYVDRIYAANRADNDTVMRQLWADCNESEAFASSVWAILSRAVKEKLEPDHFLATGPKKHGAR